MVFHSFMLRLWISLVHFSSKLSNISYTYSWVAVGRFKEYIPRDGNDHQASPMLSLLQAGYLPPTPLKPTIAFSIHSLELSQQAIPDVWVVNIMKTLSKKLKFQASVCTSNIVKTFNKFSLLFSLKTF